MEEERFYPKMYPVDIEIGQNEGDNAAGSASLDNDFVLTGIRHEIISDGSGNAPTQDGAYRIDWSIQNTTRFYKGSALGADAAFGSVRHGRWKNLDSPLKIGENRTLEARVVNTITRPQRWTVQVIFVGLEPAPKSADNKF